MTGQKLLPHALAEYLHRAFHNSRFRTAHIREQSFLRENGPDPLDQVDDCEDRSSQHHHLAAAHRVARIGKPGIDCAAVASFFKDRFTIASDNAPGKFLLAQGQTQRSADEARADNRDLPDRHRSLASLSDSVIESSSIHSSLFTQ
jgi:hypothetical protein